MERKLLQQILLISQPSLKKKLEVRSSFCSCPFWSLRAVDVETEMANEALGILGCGAGSPSAYFALLALTTNTLVLHSVWVNGKSNDGVASVNDLRAFFENDFVSLNNSIVLNPGRSKTEIQ
ncbi:hypothetical protein O9929_17900 [Vibrio lentus]|nr:hypothetical protein [Vibrio lentus]